MARDTGRKKVESREMPATTNVLLVRHGTGGETHIIRNGLIYL